MMKFPSILLLAVALINVYLASGFSTNRVLLPTQTGLNLNNGLLNNGLRLYATKEKAPVEEAPKDKKGPGGKDVIRGILWATTPWIFNSYEDTKNYVDGKKTVVVVVPEKKEEKKRGNTRYNEVFETTGSYNMADPSRAPVMSGSVTDASQKQMKSGLKGEVIEAPKVNFFSSLTGSFQQAARGNAGATVLGDPSKWKRPKKTLILYEYEGSAYCKRVREAMSMLDLTVEYRPCPNARYGFSDELSTRTLGTRTVPFLVDPSNSMGKLGSLGESDKIVEYLFDYFGPGIEAIPATLKDKIGSSTQAGGKLISNWKVDNMRKKPIDIWGFEGSASVRPVRETLCGLALAHRMTHCAKGSANIAKLTAKAGKADLPYMEDPNTNTKLTGSAEIIKYLTGQYTSK